MGGLFAFLKFRILAKSQDPVSFKVPIGYGLGFYPDQLGRNTGPWGLYSNNGNTLLYS
jgi:hypothetical protein